MGQRTAGGLRSLGNPGGGGGEPLNVLRHKVRSSSRPSDRTRSISASSAARSKERADVLSGRRLAGGAGFALAGRRGFPRYDPIEALACPTSPTPNVRPSFLRTTPAKKPRTECCCQSVAFMI